MYTKARLSYLSFFILLFTAVIFLKCSDNNIQNKNDSLFNADDIMIDPFPETMPTPIISLAEIQNGFLEQVDTNKMIDNIFIKTVVDSSGNVIKSEILKGNQNYTDTLALKYVFTLKFIPGKFSGKNSQMFLSLPLFKNSLKETDSLIKRNGKWYEKTKD